VSKGPSFGQFWVALTDGPRRSDGSLRLLTPEAQQNKENTPRLTDPETYDEVVNNHLGCRYQCLDPKLLAS